MLKVYSFEEKDQWNLIIRTINYVTQLLSSWSIVVGLAL